MALLGPIHKLSRHGWVHMKSTHSLKVDFKKGKEKGCELMVGGIHNYGLKILKLDLKSLIALKDNEMNSW
jgi:hypothetical protein